MTRNEVKGIWMLVNEDITAGQRECDISLEQKALINLKTLASGSFQNS